MKNFALGFMLITLLTACGPMNTERISDAELGHTEKISKNVMSTQNNIFLVYMTPQGQGTSAGLEVGDNTYAIHGVRAADLSSLSDQAKITISYWMPDMPTMGKSDATAIRQNDGSYDVTLFYSMAGKWEITITIQDGTKQDNYVFETNL